MADIISLDVSVSGSSSLNLLNLWIAKAVSLLLDGGTLIANGGSLYDRQNINVWLRAERDSWNARVQQQP